MAMATVPTVVNTRNETAASWRSQHNGHRITHVAQVVNPLQPQIQLDPRGQVPGIMDIWYCQTDHSVHIDTVS